MRRKSPYEVQRFHFCRHEFNFGGETCDTAFTQESVLLCPGEDAAGALNPLIPGPLVDSVSKGIVLGGMRFWLEWATNSDNWPAVLADTITTASILWYIAKVPVNPETLQLSYVPAPMTASHQGDRAQQENLLWTRLEHQVFGFNDATTVTEIVSSTGTWGFRGTGVDTWVVYPQAKHHERPERIKTKRRLGEFDALVLGCATVVGVTGISQTPIPVSVDMYGQMAVKRDRRGQPL